MNANVAPDRMEVATSAFLKRPHRLLIGGKWLPAASGAPLDVINPSTAQVFATIAGGGAAEIDAAVRAARRAFSSGPWGKLRAVERAKLLYRLADAVEANADDIAWLESLDGGNPFRSVRHIDIAMAIDSLRPSGCQQDLLHRIHQGRQIHPGRRGGEHEARDARTRWQAHRPRWLLRRTDVADPCKRRNEHDAGRSIRSGVGRDYVCRRE